MEERHENEQYFFDDVTLARLTDFVGQFEAPCCLCAPSLGKNLTERGIEVDVLDIDPRFSNLSGFRHFDILNPEWVGKKYGLIVCDPPFFNVSLSKLFSAIRLLAQHDFSRPILISYLSRRAKAFESAFAPFDVKPISFYAKYKTVVDCDRNRIQFFTNLPSESVAALCEGEPEDMN